MRSSPSLGALNLALVSFYFAPVWAREAIRMLLSPYSGFEDRGHSAKPETPWTFENGARSAVLKTAAEKTDDGKSYRVSQWRLLCFNSDQFELDFQRKAVPDPIFASVSIANGGPKPLYFTSASTKQSGFDLWGLRMTRASVRSLADARQLDFTETSRVSDGRRLAHTQKLSSEGLASALERLLATCPPAKNATAAQATGARDTAAK